MKKSTIYESFYLKKLPILFGLTLSVGLFAQNEKQTRDIQSKTNTKALTTLTEQLKKNQIPEQELILKAQKYNTPYKGEVENKLYQLQSFKKRKNIPLYYTTYNIGAANGTNTSKLNSIFNLEGSGIKIREWDGGAVKTTHTEFGGRAVQKDTPAALSDHATHVAGTLIAGGTNSNAKGMAPKATLDTYDWNSDEVEMAAAAAAGALVSNHSYGYLGGFEWGDWSGNLGWHWFGSDADTEYIEYGQYSQADADWDNIANNAVFYLPVKAAGNPRGGGPVPGGLHYVYINNTWVTSNKVRQVNGGDSGFDCVNNGSSGKNILVVAAAEKITGGYKSPADVKIAGFSAFGPTDDGRIKPDITGIGVDVFSALSSSNTAYGSMSGTSMASPNVTGSLALLQEHYSKLNTGVFMKASTLKALAIHTANEAGDAPGPDYKHGWGLLNAFKAAQTISVKDKYSLIQERTLNNQAKDIINLTASGKEPLVATIVWNDPIPTTLSNDTVLDDPTSMLVNDLDSKIIKDTETFLPWVLDPANPTNPATKGNNTRDNVEQIVIENPVAGATYQLEVSHKGTLASSQGYSLIVTGVNQGVMSDVAVTSIDIQAPLKEYSATTPVKISYENLGLNAVTGGVINYSLINKDNANAVVSNGSFDVSLAIGEKASKIINLDLSTSFVNYEIVAEFVLASDEVSANNKQSISTFGILANLVPENTKHNFGFENDFNQFGWTSEDTDGDDRTWMKYDDATLAKTGTSFATSFPNLKVQNSDWMFSNPVKLKANTLYRVIFQTRKFRTLNEKLQLAIGKSPNSASMTTNIGPEIAPTDAYVKKVIEFTPTEDDIYYIGFHHYTGAGEQSYAIFVDDASIQNAMVKPDVDFTASTLKPNTFQTVTLTNETITASTLPISSYEWTITPNTFTYQNGSNLNSKDPQVKFDQQGKYTISLKAVNAKGESVLTKTDYITVANTATKAVFSADKTSIFENEFVTFANTSTGNPSPTTWEWTITPSQGVSFLNGTSATSLNPIVKFGNTGKYTVKLKATSENNSDEVSKVDYIQVKTMYNPISNLTYQYNKDSKDLKLTWNRPLMLPIYTEGFENNGTMPADITQIDEDNDTKKWLITSAYKNTGKYSALSYSWAPAGPYNVSNWLITSKINKGAESLKFWVKHDWKEQYDVYLVSAPTSGQIPTLDEIKAGSKVYDYTGATVNKVFKEITVDISQKTANDFYLAFHHKSTVADDGFLLAIDDISVGYDNSNVKENSISKVVLSEEKVNILEGYKEKALAGKILLEELPTEAKNEGLIKEFATTTFPKLTGYEVYRDTNSVATITDYNTLTSTDNVVPAVYIYDVYATYSDGTKSTKKTITVDLSALGTEELDVQKLQVYPNPSNGLFNIVAGSNISSLKAKVYDISGKLIYQKDFSGSKISLDLTNYPKGIYILNLIDNKEQQQSIKLMIK